MTREVRVLESPAALARGGAELFVAAAGEAIRANGRFAVALSGGHTPRALFALLAAAPLREAVDWPRVEFFWGDERTVPPEHPDSNFRMARETLLGPLGMIPLPTKWHIRFGAPIVLERPSRRIDGTAVRAIADGVRRRVQRMVRTMLRERDGVF